MDLKKRTNDILDIASPGDVKSRIFDIFIVTLIFINVVVVILETIHSLSIQFLSTIRAWRIWAVVPGSSNALDRSWSRHFGAYQSVWHSVGAQTRCAVCNSRAPFADRHQLLPSDWFLLAATQSEAREYPSIARNNRPVLPRYLDGVGYVELVPAPALLGWTMDARPGGIFHFKLLATGHGPPYRILATADQEAPARMG